MNAFLCVITAGFVVAGCATTSHDYARTVRVVESPRGGVIGYAGPTGADKAEALARDVCGGPFDLLETNDVETVTGSDTRANVVGNFGASSTRARTRHEVQATFRCR